MAQDDTQAQDTIDETVEEEYALTVPRGGYAVLVIPTMDDSKPAWQGQVFTAGGPVEQPEVFGVSAYNATYNVAKDVLNPIDTADKRAQAAERKRLAAEAKLQREIEQADPATLEKKAADLDRKNAADMARVAKRREAKDALEQRLAALQARRQAAGDPAPAAAEPLPAVATA